MLHVPVTRKRRKNKEDEKDKIKMNHEFFVFLKKKREFFGEIVEVHARKRDCV